MDKRYIIVIVFLCLLVVCLGCNQQAKLEEENKAVVMQAAEATNNFNYDRLAELYAPDFKRHCQATPEISINSSDGFLALTKEFGKAFPDGHIRVDMLIAEGDLVAFWGSYLGTHTGPMGEIPATGKEIDSEMGGVHRVVDGKIVETWVTWDNITLLSQLGLYPPPADTTTSQEG